MCELTRSSTRDGLERMTNIMKITSACSGETSAVGAFHKISNSVLTHLTKTLCCSYLPKNL